MTGPISPDWPGRLARVAHDLSARDLDALVVSTPANLRYLTGFIGSAGLLCVSAGEAWLLVDGRYSGSAEQARDAGRLGPVRLDRVPGGFAEALAARVSGCGWRRVGFEAAHVTVATLDAWTAAVTAVDWARTDGLVERMRQIKDPIELGVLREAAVRLSEVAAALPDLVAPGATEREVARRIDHAIDRAGFSDAAFPTIVASGPNSALPHARPTDRRLGPGDLVVLDFGGVLDGYCVDLTRMAALEPIEAGAWALFDAVRAAQAAALAQMRPGVAASDIDAAARQVLADRGLAEAFLHATGHGLGLDVHEAPRIGRRTEAVAEVLAEGMVCTIEPGAYVAGVGGVRLEDDVLVTSGGHEVLTTAPRDLLVV
jgi:Xaa-Pro aminopeptidase